MSDSEIPSSTNGISTVQNAPDEGNGMNDSLTMLGISESDSVSDYLPETKQPARRHPRIAERTKQMSDSPMCDPSGGDLVVAALKAVRRREGVDEAMDVAKEMIIAASSILACEIGVEGALAVLAAAAQVLPDRYGRALQ